MRRVVVRRVVVRRVVVRVKDVVRRVVLVGGRKNFGDLVKECLGGEWWEGGGGGRGENFWGFRWDPKRCSA